MTAGKKGTIVWLEDRPQNHEYVEKICQGSGFLVTACRTLEEFHKVCLEGLGDDLIKGFVIDVLLPYDNLEPLGLEFILTGGGTDTGICVLEHYLLNYDELPETTEISRRYKSCPVLVYSTLQNVGQRYEHIDEDSVTFATKEPFTSQEEVRKWLGTWDA